MKKLQPLVRGRLAAVGGGKDKAVVIPGVQGIASSLDDVVLNGRKMTAEIGQAIEDARLERSIEGASTLTVDVADDHFVLTDSPILSESFDLELDGLAFRFVKASKSGLSEPLELTTEDLEVALLRARTGARKAARGKVTRAEFARRLVREVKPPIPFYSPQLHTQQPIASAAEARQDSAGKLARREPGLPPNARITVKGARADAEQIRNTERVLDVCRSRHSPEKVMVAAVCTINAESTARNLAGGDRDSVGLFQQRGSQGWPASRDIERDTTAFIQAAMRVWRRDHGISVPALCQAVQRSGVPSAFNATADEARKTVDLYLGGTTAQASKATREAITGKYQFERKADENTWDCTGRLADEVQWRRFVSARIFYFLAETHMLASKSRALISPSSPGIEDLSFDFDVGKPITEIEVQARARSWACPPGSAADVEECGPANGTYIVSKISAPMRRANSLCTISLKRPAEPLPEPAPPTKTRGPRKTKRVRSSSASSSDDVVDRVFARMKELKGVPYVWGGGHGGFISGRPRGLDCSSAVSYALHAGGLIDVVMVSGALARWGDPGPGESITVYGNAGHAWMEIRIGGKWMAWGTSVGDGGSGGLGFHPQPSASYKAGFTKRHPRGH